MCSSDLRREQLAALGAEGVAPFRQRQVEERAARAVGRRWPGACARDTGADDGRAVGIRPLAAIDGFRAGLGIDVRDDVLRARVDGEEVLAGGGVEHVENRHLPDIQDHFPPASLDRHRDDLPLEDPVEIPLIVRDVLEVPDQLPGIRIERDRAVRVERVARRAGGAGRME